VAIFRPAAASEESLAYGTPKREELRCGHKVLLAVIDCHWYPSLAQHGCRREPDLAEPYPKGVRGFETIWYVDGHLSLTAQFRLETVFAFRDISPG